MIKSTNTIQKQKKKYIIPITLISFILFFPLLGLVVSLSKRSPTIGVNPSKEQLSELQSTPSPKTKKTITGVIRTSGLNDDKKSKYGLENVNYQLTHINNPEAGGEFGRQYKIQGYYLLSDNAATFLGKCVQITGVEEQILTDSTDSEVIYHHTLAPEKIVEQQYTYCNPYPEESAMSPNYHVFTDIIDLNGILERKERQTPYDFDYQLKLTAPLSDKYSNNLNQQQINMLDVVPFSNTIWQEVEKNIDNKLDVKGYRWFSGDSSYFVITAAGFEDDLSNQIHALPSNIYPNQITKTYTFNNIDYAIYSKGNMNYHISKSSPSSGVLVAYPNTTNWTSFAEVIELSESSNNLIKFDYRDGIYSAIVVDTHGAGSGEGVAKYFTLNQGAQNWKLSKCFYYGDSIYDWSVTISTSLQDKVIEFLSSYPEEEYPLESKNCTNAKLVKH